MPDVYKEEGRYTLLYGLAHAAFPEQQQPGALVHLADGVSRDDLAVVIYLHGWDNCAENVVRARPGRCPPAEEICPAADLIGHLARTGRRAMLLVPELRYHQKTSDPGALGRSGALRALLAEVLARLAAQLDGATVEDVRRVVLFSHSGGYRAAAALATRGGVPVQELYLLDSFYGEEEAFAAFLYEDLASFAAEPGRRFVSLYQGSGESVARNRALGQQVATWLREEGLPAETLVCDDATQEPGDDELEAGILIRRVPTAHSDIPITYAGRLLQTSGLP